MCKKLIIAIKTLGWSEVLNTSKLANHGIQNFKYFVSKHPLIMKQVMRSSSAPVNHHMQIDTQFSYIDDNSIKENTHLSNERL
jgi:hypothetical protein